MAERSEAKSAKRSFASKILIRNIFLTRSFASRFLFRYATAIFSEFLSVPIRGHTYNMTKALHMDVVVRGWSQGHTDDI